MVLSEQDANFFYRLMGALQAFVNRKLNLIPDFSTADEYQKIEPERKLKVRDALYKNIELIDEFIQENPQRFTDEELGIIRKWHKFIGGEFFIEHYLSKHAIFIKEKAVYAVLGLYDSFDRLIGNEELPVYVKTVLLPFKGQIVFDGLMERHPFVFGGGIRSDLRETYLIAKQNNRVIESLEPGMLEGELKKLGKPAKDWSAKVDALLMDAQVLRGGAGVSPIQGAVFSLVKASLELAQTAVRNSEDIGQLWSGTHKIDRALRKVITVLDRTIISIS